MFSSLSGKRFGVISGPKVSAYQLNSSNHHTPNTTERGLSPRNYVTLLTGALLPEYRQSVSR